MVGIENGVAVRVLLGKPRRQTEEYVAGEDGAVGVWKLVKRGGTEERLEEADLAAERFRATSPYALKYCPLVGSI